MRYDVVVVGGGPAGLAAALTLGRGRRRVLVCDSGPRRNAAAVRMHGFVSRDGIAPEAFRREARRQLEAYPNVELRDVAIEQIRGEKGSFEVRLADGSVGARRILLCTGMVDELPEIEGARALWGRSIFQCPYCHGWEIQDRRFGYLALEPELLSFPLMLRGWTSHVTLLTGGRIEVPQALAERFARAGVEVDARPLARLVARDGRLAAVEFVQGEPRSLDALFVHPSQRQVALVQSLMLAQTPTGHLVVDSAQETSTPGIHAAGDLTTRVQSAILAAAAGTLAAGALNHALTTELAERGKLP